MTLRRTLTWGGTTPPDGPCPRGHGFLNQPVRSLRAHVRVHKPGQKGYRGVYTFYPSPPAGLLIRAPLWGALGGWWWRGTIWGFKPENFPYHLNRISYYSVVSSSSFSMLKVSGGFGVAGG